MKNLFDTFGPYSRDWEIVYAYLTDAPQTISELSQQSGVARQKLNHILTMVKDG